MADISDLALSADFAPATEADWRLLVDKTLGEAPFSSLERTTAEGLRIEPLYAPAASSTAPARAAPADRAWEVATVTSHPDPVRANREILADLNGGAAAAVVRIDPTGKAGVAAGSAADLERVLDGVILELAPLALDAGFLGPQAADWLDAAAKSSPAALLRFHLDPLSAYAEAGASPGPVEAHLIAAANVAVRLAETYPKAQIFLASGRVVHEAGGGEALEIAVAAAAAVARGAVRMKRAAPRRAKAKVNRWLSQISRKVTASNPPCRTIPTRCRRNGASLRRPRLSMSRLLTPRSLPRFRPQPRVPIGRPIGAKKAKRYLRG